MRAVAGPRLDDLREGGQDQAEGEKKADERESQPRVVGSEEEGGEESHEQGSQRRRDDAHVEIFQRLHIPDDACQQVARAELHQAGGRERFEFFVEPDAQAGKQAEGDVVRDEPFGVAQQAAADAEEAHADDGHAQLRHGRMERGHRDEPGRGAHERDAGEDGQRAEQDGERDEMPTAGEEGEETGEDGRATGDG